MEDAERNSKKNKMHNPMRRYIREMRNIDDPAVCLLGILNQAALSS